MLRKLAICKNCSKLRTLKGNNIQLRALENSDLEILYDWENDPENWKVSQTLTPFSRKLLIKYLDQAHLDLFQIKQLRLVIELRESCLAIGLIDLFDFDPFNQKAGIGILIGEKAEREKGYAGEALRILLDYCFSILLLNQVYCNILESNKQSQHLFTQAGFSLSGTKKSWVKTNSGWEDEYFFQLLSQDWLSR